MSESHIRIQKISNIFPINNYLEIGVSEGYTFNKLNFKNMVGVDPLFKFDITNIQSESKKLYPISSDSFFSNPPDRTKYDLVFLDGLHTYDQTLRDFNNSLFFTHENSLILIDDIFPEDIYSSLRSGDEAVKFRKLLTGSDGLAWHGDVYKLIFFIHDFFPQFSWVTTDKGNGNPQAILFRKPRKNFSPFFSNLELIHRLDYFTLLSRIDIFNFLPEDEAIEYACNQAQSC